jgi:uncharacterized membrane protein (UPF0136 family)
MIPAYLLINIVVGTKYIVASNYASKEGVYIQLLSTIHLLLDQQKRFVDSNKQTQVLGMLLGGIKDKSNLVSQSA